jgi:hypothetical protein
MGDVVTDHEWKDKDDSVITNHMLFGSAGAAVLLEKKENNKLVFMNRSDGQRYKSIMRYHGGFAKMDGQAVFDFAINDVVDSVSEFKKSSRFRSGYDTAVDSEGNYSPAEPETYWAKYKRAGLLLTTADYSSVTNSTDYATISTELKKELMDIYNRDEFIINDVAQSEYLDTLPYVSGNGLTTANYETGNTIAYNLLVVTSATVNASAKFEKKDDINSIYTNLYYYYHEKLSYISDLYNENNELNENQVKAYILEYADNSTSNTLPSAISSAITSFLSPVYTKYTSTATQRELLISWCEKATSSTFTFQNTMNADATLFTFIDGSTEKYSDRFNNIRNINKTAADSYYTLNRFDTKFGGNSSVYDSWWTDLENYIKGNM